MTNELIIEIASLSRADKARLGLVTPTPIGQCRGPFLIKAFLLTFKHPFIEKESHVVRPIGRHVHLPLVHGIDSCQILHHIWSARFLYRFCYRG